MIFNIQEINYHVITGTFKNGFNAWDQVNKLNKLGYKTAKILPKKNQLFKVSVISFKNYDSAVQFQKKIVLQGFNNTNIEQYDFNNDVIDYNNSDVSNNQENEILENNKVSLDKIENLEKIKDSTIEKIEKETNNKSQNTFKNLDDCYEIVVGSYSNGFNAWDKVNELKKKGFKSSKILKRKNNLYRVSVQQIKNLNKFQNLYLELKENQINEFNILKISKTNSNELLEELIDYKNIIENFDNKSQTVQNKFFPEDDLIDFKESSEKIVSKDEGSNQIKEELDENKKEKNKDIVKTNNIIYNEENSIINQFIEVENSEEKLNVEKIAFTNNTKIDSDNKSNEILDNEQNINLDQEINTSQNIEIQNNQTSKRKDKRKKSGFNIFSALQDFDRKAYTSALEKYLNLVYSGKENYEILNYISNSYYNNSQYDKAVIWFNKLISKYPKKITAENYYRASLSFKSQGAYGVSNQLLEKYIEKTNNLIVKNYYYQNPNYLDQILKNSILAEIKKTNINSENSDFGPGFYGENKLIYSSTISSTGNDLYEWTDEPFLDLFISDIDSLGNLSDPKQVTGDVNTPYHESSAILSKDKKTLYFTRNNFFKGDLDFDKNKQVNLKIYKAESEDGETWGNIQELPFNDDEFSTAHPAFSIDEKRLYFASDRPGSFGYSDIWYVDILDDGEYGDPVNLGPNINTEFRESFPFISSDNILYFSSDGRMGLGGFDIYYSNLDSYGFPDESINFGKPLNSRMDDFGFIYNSKNNFGYFSSNRNGYNGSKSDEVYQFKMLASSPCGSVLSGIVRDKNTGQILPGAEVELEDNYGNLIARQIVKEDAKYDFSNEAECSKCYTVKARKGIGYSSFQKNICIPESSTKIFTNIELDWAKDCIPDDLECLFNINPIYFDLDKYYIRRDAAKELKKVYTVMIRYPNIKIHIESHTDSRASNRYNLALSYNRARSTKSWLVKRGINEERISTSALGEMDLDNYCEDNINCQEQEHQMNRRSIFKIREN
tara:strand:+ start:7231 stop:10248 length:3018 start_codon:yes stop_codon:yes gene_type:complete